MSNSNDPLGLFATRDQSPPLAGPPSVAPQPPTPRPATDFSTLLIGALIGIAMLLVYQRLKSGDSFGDRQQQEQQDDSGDRKRQTKSEYKTLIFLHERNPQPIEHDLLLREMPAFCEANKLQFRAFDDDITDEPIPDLLDWAKSKGIQPPLVILTGNDDKPIRAAKWPSGLDELKALLK